MAAGATYEPIATQTLGSAASSITFSSIAASWTDLRVVFVVTETAANQPYFQFNSDTASNYSQTNLSANGSTAYSNRNSNTTRIFFDINENYSTTIPALATIDVFSYTSSNYKTSLVTSSLDLNGSGYLARVTGLWRSTSAITSITIADAGTTFKAGTIATLYGIKNA